MYESLQFVNREVAVEEPYVLYLAVPAVLCQLGFESQFSYLATAMGVAPPSSIHNPIIAVDYKHLQQALTCQPNLVRSLFPFYEGLVSLVRGSFADPTFLSRLNILFATSSIPYFTRFYPPVLPTELRDMRDKNTFRIKVARFMARARYKRRISGLLGAIEEEKMLIGYKNVMCKRVEVMEDLTREFNIKFLSMPSYLQKGKK